MSWAFQFGRGGGHGRGVASQARISSLCSPSVGRRLVVADLGIAERGSGCGRGRRPDRRRRRSRAVRARAARRARRPRAIELIGPHGTPALLRATNRSSADHSASWSTRIGWSSCAVRGAVGVEPEPLVVGDLGDPQHLAQRTELAVVGGGDDDVAVLGRHRLVRVDAGVRVAHPVRHDAGRRERTASG